MIPTDAQVIARARALWPALTVTAAPDALLEAWLPWCRAVDEGSIDWTTYLDRLANLVAHCAYRVDPTGALGGGGASGGAAASVRTGDLSVTYGEGGRVIPSHSPTTAWLASTAPGAAYLALRDSRGVVASPLAVW